MTTTENKPEQNRELTNEQKRNERLAKEKEQRARDNADLIARLKLRKPKSPS